MENFSPTLFVIGVALVATVIVGLGMQIYIKNFIENKHTYTVSFDYWQDGIISEIKIEY